MSKKFWLKKITLHKSPGFASGSFPPVARLGQHLNVLWGPNGVGKSSLTRAMRALIWNTKSSGALEAEGTLQAPDSEWSLSLAQGKLSQVRLMDNQELLLPGRNDELSESYWFTLHELLQEDEKSTGAFLKQVRTSMQGGVDLDVACQNAGGGLSFAGGNILQSKQARQANEEVKQILKSQGEHQGIQDELARLQQELDRGPELSSRKALLEEAQALSDVSKRIEEQEQKLFLYSPSLALIDKSSPKRLAELLEAHDKALGNEASLIQNRDRLHQSFLSCAIEEKELQDLEKSGRIANHYNAYKDALVYQKSCEQEFAVAKEHVQEWEREHSWLIGESVEDTSLEAYVDTLRTLARECEPIRCGVAANKRLLDELGEYEAIKHPIDDLSLLHVRLSDWMESFWKLQGTAKNKALQPGVKKILLILMLAIGGGSSWLGIAIHPAFFILGVAFMLLSVVLLIPSSTKNSEYAKAEQELLQAEAEGDRLLKKLAMGTSYTWEVKGCQKLMESVRLEIAETYRLEQQNQRRKLAFDHLNASTDRLQKWVNDWQSAAKALGLKGDEARLEGSQFFHFAERLQTWSTYRLAFVGKQEVLSVAQEETRRTLGLLQVELDTKESEISALKAMVDSLIKRFGDALSFQSGIAENRVRLHETQQRLQESKEAITEFWKKVDLEFGNEAELSELVAKLDQWNDLKFSLKYNRKLFAEKREKNPRALEMARLYSALDLSDALASLGKEQKELEEKRVRFGGLRATFDALKFGSSLSNALLKEESAQAELEAFRNEQVASRMIATLAEDLKSESEKQFQPQVLKHASAWLSDITNHRYTLSASKDGFFATDTIMAKNFTLDELSSGTRIHLLFSIRMAFITMQEETSGVTLPIFLDELLANSDDDRALAITQAIGNIAQDRQVFYVTAQRDEVEKLKTIATSEVTVISLEDLQRNYKVSQNPIKRYVYDRNEVPPPLEDYQEYGKTLSVAGPSLWDPIEALHSWHLLADSEALYGYLKLGLKHVGQLISAKAAQNPTLYFRLELLKAAQQRSQQGRARTVHLSDLDDPALDLNRGAKFWSQIEAVVGGEGCSGGELLEAVQDKRIQRFTEGNLEVLSNWLFENRFASDTKRKEAHAILDELFVEFELLTVGSDDHVVVERWLASVIG